MQQTKGVPLLRHNDYVMHYVTQLKREYQIESRFFMLFQICLASISRIAVLCKFKEYSDAYPLLVGLVSPRVFPYMTETAHICHSSMHIRNERRSRCSRLERINQRRPIDINSLFINNVNAAMSFRPKNVRNRQSAKFFQPLPLPFPLSVPFPCSDLIGFVLWASFEFELAVFDQRHHFSVPHD